MLQLSVSVENTLRALFRRHDEDGGTAVEYSLMAGIICVGIVGAFTYFTKSVQKNFNKVPETWNF